MAATEKIEFECGVCANDVEETDPWRFGDDAVCWDCRGSYYVENFKKALAYDVDYPVKWQNEIIDVAMIAPFVDAEFIAHYRLKDQKANTPGRDRRLCQHKTPDDKPFYEVPVPALPPDSKVPSTECDWLFDPELDAFKVDAPRQLVVCNRCSGYSCNKCGKAIFDLRNYATVLKYLEEEHVCTSRWATEGDGTEGMEGLKRGKDYQVCPNKDCLTRIQLAAACNHMVCTKCNTNFCYICGVEATHNSGHWTRGMPCPRFHQPGAPNAIFDRPPRRRRAVLTEAEMNDPVRMQEIRRSADHDWRRLYYSRLDIHIPRLFELCSVVFASRGQQRPDWLPENTPIRGRLRFPVYIDDENNRVVHAYPPHLMDLPPGVDQPLEYDQWLVPMMRENLVEELFTRVLREVEVIDDEGRQLSPEDTVRQRVAVAGTVTRFAKPLAYTLETAGDLLDPPTLKVPREEPGHFDIIVSWRKLHGCLIEGLRHIHPGQLSQPWLETNLEQRGRCIVHIKPIPEWDSWDLVSVQIEHDEPDRMVELEKTFRETTWPTLDCCEEDFAEHLAEELDDLAVRERRKWSHLPGTEYYKEVFGPGDPATALRRIQQQALPSASFVRSPKQTVVLERLNQSTIAIHMEAQQLAWVVFVQELREADENYKHAIVPFPLPMPGQTSIEISTVGSDNHLELSKVTFDGLKQEHEAWLRSVGLATAKGDLPHFVFLTTRSQGPEHTDNRIPKASPRPIFNNVTNGDRRMTISYNEYLEVCKRQARADGREDEIPDGWTPREQWCRLLIDYRYNEAGEGLEITAFNTDCLLLGTDPRVLQWFEDEDENDDLDFWEDFGFGGEYQLNVLLRISEEEEIRVKQETEAARIADGVQNLKLSGLRSDL